MRQEIAVLLDRLRPNLPKLRALAPETIHLTLRFLGETTAEQVAVMTPHLAAAAAACPAQDVRIHGLGTFPERGAPKVLWLGLDLAESLLALQRACEEAAVGAGFAAEPRPFRAHLTLGRWRDRVRGPDLPAADLGHARVESLVLFESELRPQGAVHTPLARFRLAVNS